MYRRYFLADNLPLPIEEFKRKRLRVYKFNNVTSIEELCELDTENCVSKTDWYLISFTNNYLTTKKLKRMNIKQKIEIEEFTNNCYLKTRYYIPLTSILNAEIDVAHLKVEDYYGEFNPEHDPIINVNFNSKEEADNFEIPSWFGPELIPELMVKTKRKSK